MKQNTAQNVDYFAATHAALVEDPASSQTEKHSYASTLRTLGHALEAHHFLGFELTLEDDTYVIKGRVSPVATPKRTLFQTICSLMSKPNRPVGVKNKNNELELRYSIDEIQALDDHVRSQRKESPEIPDPHSISQLLRGIGCYLDRRHDSKLVGVSIEDRWVTIMHHSSDGRLLRTCQDIEYFYDFWVKMYMHRSSRPSPPAPSDPTVRRRPI